MSLLLSAGYTAEAMKWCRRAVSADATAHMSVSQITAMFARRGADVKAVLMSIGIDSLPLTCMRPTPLHLMQMDLCHHDADKVCMFFALLSLIMM